MNANHLASGQRRSSWSLFTDRMLPAANRLRELPPRAIASAAGMALLVWAYWPNLVDLYQTWRDEPNYSHGFLVIPIALVICWQRARDKAIDWSDERVVWWSWIPLIAVLGLRLLAYEHDNQWSETATVVPAIACLVLALGGWALLERAWPAILFLIFMLPLPRIADSAIALPLQRIAAVGSVFLMQLTGLWTIAEGNVIILRDHANHLKTLEVAQACNGLSMLMTLAATVTATIMLIPLAAWKRVVVLLSAIPIALISNIIRIVSTGWCYYLIEGEAAKKAAHDMTGVLLMMPLALMLVGLELVVLSWLADDRGREPEEDAGRPVLAVLPQKPATRPLPKTPRDDV